MNLLQSEYEVLLNKVKKQRLKYAQNILKQKVIQHKGYRMRFQYFIHGQKPVDGYRLVFGFHGGGNCPFEVNQQQWNNHKHLYDGLIPSGTIWFVPRSAEQASDKWWKQYIPQFMTLIIQCFSIMSMIDNNRVFVTGYSAGGDGIYHLASMMTDLIAGAAMMAGHPNKADVFNIRNIAFSIQLGQLDDAYDRANWGKVYIDKIDEFAIQYGGFKQYSQIHKNTPHWMGKKDAQIFPRFLNEVRQPYPDFILFKQHARTFKKTFYYIKVEQKHKGVISVRRKGNVFEIQSPQKKPVTIMFNSYLVDFNKQVEIYHNGDLTIKRLPEKNKNLIQETIEEFVDPWFIFQDQLISIPSKGLPKDYKIFRPFQMQKHKSSSQQIKRMEQQIYQDQNLHVSFNLKRKQASQNSLDQRSSNRQRQNPSERMNHQPRHHNSFSQKIKRLEQSCQRNCEIF